ncbi:MAG: hypothetical protein QOH31_3916 [Verrucomicrobiota bacterium]|jgi:hypothetical protein
MAAGPDLPWLRRKCQLRLARQIDPGSSIYLERPTKTSGEGLVNCLRFPQIGETIFANASGCVELSWTMSDMMSDCLAGGRIIAYGISRMASSFGSVGQGRSVPVPRSYRISLPARNILPANLAATVEVYCPSARFKSVAKTQLYVSAGLAIKKRALERFRQRIPGARWFKADNALPAFLAFALIFRDLLNETQTQSHFATDTRNIQELGISEFKVRQGL